MPVGTADMDPLDRRVIVVADRGALTASLATSTAGHWLDLGMSFVGGLAYLTFRAGRPVVEYIARKQVESMDDGDVADTLAESLELGVPIALYSPAEALRLFQFGVGHTPKNGSLYVQHPVLPNTYIPPEDFSRTLSREKEAAFRQLASALGAKELRLVSAQVHTKRGLFGSKVSVPEAASQVGIKVAFDENGSFVKKVYSRFGKPRTPPRVPPDLAPWVDMDADLRTIARDRTEGHLLENHITLEFKEGMGVGGEIAAKVAGRGLTAGGSFQRLYHSVWHFEAEYWPLDDSDKAELSAD